ncbi:MULTISPECIES: glycosyltransferase family 4 protein [Cyanophyceae]|uniref:glycosyltransferase family 4 protein n=1 Tax=Cyanophyceae TaxID=3028117 RepID=UPI001685FEE8|nr:MULTISPECIES: glycosyltransferase family 4 protein [Cyanophyceae]MBD1915043.1 glycosyltransferase family 4 protein [Phormidium sp. FACHB-77]MBD2030791.1 glycosyltransferase family 4 protein [Phormidium sp. FACHB-322]MBD2053144.1 glycosyltransferase family 4 protein [Leptolyngbya sp. FACHB-60]
MKIAQITPLWERVPPLAYGGTEMVVSLLTEELTRRGHQVTLFASGDSQTQSRLVPGCHRALRSLGLLPLEYASYEQRQLENVFQSAGEFDLIHSHMDLAALPYAHLSPTPVVHTLHELLTPAFEKIFRQYRQQNLVTVSRSQQRPEVGLNYIAAIYNAIAIDQFDFYPLPQEPPYLAYLGRMSEEKGPHLAIEIAKRSGCRLKMAGKIEFEDQTFFEQQVAPLIDGQQIEFLGEVTQPQKKALIGHATATLFPITWPEPFSLGMAESMASGTPVIALAIGSAPELVVDGKTGFLCHSVDDCIDAVAQVHRLSRRACREHVEVNFSVERMVDGYEAVYRQLVGEGQSRVEGDRVHLAPERTVVRPQPNLIETA